MGLGKDKSFCRLVWCGAELVNTVKKLPLILLSSLEPLWNTLVLCQAPVLPEIIPVALKMFIWAPNVPCLMRKAVLNPGGRTSHDLVALTQG